MPALYRTLAGLGLTFLMLGASTARAGPSEATAERVTAAVLASGFVKPEAFKVSVMNGAVELSGSVGSAYARREAERVAGQVRGVTSVTNLLTVVPSTDDLDSDQRVALRVRQALVTAGIAGAAGFDLHVFNGEVDINGTARSSDERDEVSRIVGVTRGVTAVHNALAVP